jgi:predicted dehydrogenase
MIRSLLACFIVVPLSMAPTHSMSAEPPKVPEGALRAGIIGLTTSHVIAFTGAINDPNAEGVLAEVVVTAGFPGPTMDNPSSYGRVEGYTKDLRDRGIAIYDTIEEMLPHVDVILLESVDGRPHLEQARPAIAAGKPLFIDKPMAASLADVMEIFQLAEEAKVPCFSSSSLRFGSGFQQMRNNSPIGEIRGCDAYSPCSLEEHHPDLFWYGVHGCEILFTIMGQGCETVSCTATEGTHFVVGTWEGGRIGTFRGIRPPGKTGYGATVFGTKGIQPGGDYEGYKPLVEEICKFFKTGVAPIPKEETIELFAFMEGADESKRQGGKPVSIAEMIEKAKKFNAERRNQAK